MLLNPHDPEAHRADLPDVVETPTAAVPSTTPSAAAPSSTELDLDGTAHEAARSHLVLVRDGEATGIADPDVEATPGAAPPPPLAEVAVGSPIGGPYVDVVKPALDRLMAAVLLLLTLPVLLAGMLAVRLSMGRGVLFRQRRVGKDGRLFTVLKLRTMGHDRRSTSAKDLQAYADGRWDGIERRQTHKTDADPRHTDVGRILRKLSIDELPQLVNVLRGEMSLVGPRPELPGVVERHYEPWMHRRHAVRPGVTGLWQISMRGEGDMHEHVDVDVDYVESISFTEDLRILLATPFAALGAQKGA